MTQKPGFAVPISADPHALVSRLRDAKLDLLPVLHELLRTRSVTRTARSLGISQPAVSQALQRLRTAFDDDLLVSLGRKLEPTDRAEALALPLRRVLEEIADLLSPPGPFAPASEAVHITIATADYVSVLLAPVLARMSAIEAPQLVFEFIDATIRGAGDLGRFDFLLAPRAFGHTLGKRIGSLPLWEDDIVCLAAVDNTDIPSRLTAEAFRRTRKAVYRPFLRMPEKVRAKLQPTSVLERECTFSVPDFVVLGAIVEQTNSVALVPRKLAHTLIRGRKLRIVELIYPNRQFAISAYWSLAADAKRGHRWVQGLLKRAAQQIG
jgi:DNA-binding transcriptional LysR family regulator